MGRSSLNFEEELSIGLESYNRKVGEWWSRQARNSSHVHAYKRIARHVRSLTPEKSPSIVDYGCGMGYILYYLHRLFPEGRVTGIDGSTVMLNQARKKIHAGRSIVQGEVAFHQTKLPDFSLPENQADIVIYAFPNIVSDSQDSRSFERRFRRDARVASILARPGGGKVTQKISSIKDQGLEYEHFLMDRVISRNLRHILKKGGFCIRVEYATPDGEEVTDLDLQRSQFEDGSLQEKVDGVEPDRYFEETSWTFYRSNVILDVYDQTEDETNKKGGYYITTLKAI